VTAIPSGELSGSAGQTTMRLGERIRALRIESGMTTVTLARESGVTPGFISQVERGIAAPSLKVMWAIARALDAPMGIFFEERAIEATTPRPSPLRDPVAFVVRADARKRLALPNSMTYELLSPDLRHQIELVEIVYAPGQQGPEVAYTHLGEEQLVVIQGELTVWVADQEFVLGKSDTITFSSTQRHRTANRTRRKTVAISAMTPPSF
jgi:transcriptional regulator with XRE-family HTH domain